MRYTHPIENRDMNLARLSRSLSLHNTTQGVGCRCGYTFEGNGNFSNTCACVRRLDIALHHELAKVAGISENYNSFCNSICGKARPFICEQLPMRHFQVHQRSWWLLNEQSPVVRDFLALKIERNCGGGSFWEALEKKTKFKESRESA